MTSTSESTQRSRPVKTAAVVTHGPKDVGQAVERVRAVAAATGVSIVDDPRAADLVIALGATERSSVRSHSSSAAMCR